MRESYFFYLLSRLWAICATFENRIGMLFSESFLFRSVRNFWNNVRINFKYCFFVRLADAGLQPSFFDNSEILLYLKVRYKICEKRTIYFLGASKASYLSKELKKEFYAASVKTGSMILVFSILVNILLSIIFKKEISLLNWIIQGLVLFAGLGGFSCQADWETIKKNSTIFK